mgnify:CR=1 FL=1
MSQQAESSSFLPHHHGKESADEKEQGHAKTMNEQKGNTIMA